LVFISFFISESVVKNLISMLKLSFPNYEFRLKKINQKRFIFDDIRKKYIELTPEEWVRQNCLRFLEKEKKFKKALISVEKKIQLNNTTKRFDILAHDINGNCILLVECKAPNIRISQKSFDQILSYNNVINAKYLMVTNGIIHYYCKVNKDQNKIDFLKEIPSNK
tara:strand:- start:2982 stop:3479 length:498 start_codon:yes stop_codon:yes gene_type:complete